MRASSSIRSGALIAQRKTNTSCNILLELQLTPLTLLDLYLGHACGCVSPKSARLNLRCTKQVSCAPMGRNCQGTKGTPSGLSKNQALGRFLWYLSISRRFPLEMTGDSTQLPINNAVVTIKSREGRGWRREPRRFDRISSHTHLFAFNPEAQRTHTRWPGKGEAKWGVEWYDLDNAEGLTRGWWWDDGVHQAEGAPVSSPCSDPPPQHRGN